MDGLVDFKIEVENGKELRILQITDTQIIDTSQCRHEDRIDLSSKIKWASNTLETNCFNYIRDLIKITNPDLILITGDLVYGEFDDSGSSLKKYIRLAPVFGNHDNESKRGVDWQCEMLEKAKYCLFNRGEVTGNGNYTIGIVQGGKLKRKLEWFDKTALNIIQTTKEEVKNFVCFHIPVEEFALAAVSAGYQEELQQNITYTIGSEITPAKNGDFGTKGEVFKGLHPVPVLFNLFKKHSVDGVFVGQSHMNSSSVLYEGIRWTFGLKTGTYDRFDINQLGGTYIEVQSDNSFTVKHIYLEKYEIEPDSYQHVYM